MQQKNTKDKGFKQRDGMSQTIPVADPLGAVITELKWRFFHHNLWPIFVLLFVLIIIKIAILFIGHQSPWFKKVTTGVDISPLVATISWLVVYFLAFMGLLIVLLHHPFADTGRLLMLYVVGIAISISWDVAFLFWRDIKLAALLYAVLFLWEIFLIWSLFQYEKAAGILQIPILLRTCFYAWQTSKILANNGDEHSILP
jgi:tryptophan-rich sensory protein